MDQILHHLTNSKRIFIASHVNPDGDAVGSLIALGLSLKAMKKKTCLFNESPIPAVYRFLPSVDLIRRSICNKTNYDCAVILDCGDMQRIGSVAARIKKIPVIINIDHHMTNTLFGDFHIIDPNACATAEIIYHLVKKMDVPIDQAIATAIYTGIITDTGSFRFSNTNQAAFTICHEMMNRGVAPHDVAQYVYGTYSLERIKLLNLALDSIEISQNGKLSIMTITRDMFDQTGTNPEDTDGMIHYARRIEDVKVAVLIQENLNHKKNRTKRDHIHVSLRSDGSINVAAIAASFGGGGHFSAAGFNTMLTLNEVKPKILSLANKL